MHVYLKEGNQRRLVTNVHLQEGFCPCIGNGAMKKKSCADVSRLEPAIWFKVLVLESVSVDCGRKIVSWSTGSHPEDADLPSHRKFCMEGECYDYDADIDELFTLATKVIYPAGHEENGVLQPSDEDYEQCLLRMLHCYILPKITLHQDDFDKVMNAKEKQALSIQELDRKVIEECKRIDACEVNMEDIRTQFLPDLEKFIYRGWCSKGFLEVLLEDISKEEPRLRQQIDMAQDQVQHAKSMKPSAASTDQLKTARQQRDREQEKLEALLLTRELITSASRQVGNDGGVVAGHHLLKQYLDQRKTLASLKERRNRILEQKNCALSVREMLDSAMKELIDKGYTDANDANALGSRATDVLEGAWKPEWQRLGERIATLVNNEEHPVGNHFQTFCQKIQTLCEELLTTGRFSSSEEFTPSCSPFSQACAAQTEYESYGLEDFVREDHKHKLLALQSIIKKEVETATEFLSDIFSNKDVHFKNKIRLCYEQCFYDKEHNFLACVYEQAYHEHVNKLREDVQRLRFLPIKFLNLEMKDEWWLELFEQRSVQSSTNSGNYSPFTEAFMNGTLLDQADRGLSGSYDMIDELDDSLDNVTEARNSRHIEDMESFRSLFISAIRHRSKTIAVDDVDKSRDQSNAWPPKSKNSVEAVLSCSAPTMVQIISLWKTAQCEQSYDSVDRSLQMKAPLNRTLSKSESDLSRKDSSGSGETFEDHFGPALQNIKDIFKVTSPLNKLKCLTSSLRKITNAVQELRMQSGQDTFTAAVNAEDLLPLLVLMMLQMEPWEVAAMWPQLAFTEDLMAPFLTSGCHGWALVEFQMAQRILNELCKEF